jgi:hypothetical protein
MTLPARRRFSGPAGRSTGTFRLPAPLRISQDHQRLVYIPIVVSTLIALLQLDDRIDEPESPTQVTTKDVMSRHYDGVARLLGIAQYLLNSASKNRRTSKVLISRGNRRLPRYDHSSERMRPPPFGKGGYDAVASTQTTNNVVPQ